MVMGTPESVCIVGKKYKVGQERSEDSCRVAKLNRVVISQYRSNKSRIGYRFASRNNSYLCRYSRVFICQFLDKPPFNLFDDVTSRPLCTTLKLRNARELQATTRKTRETLSVREVEFGPWTEAGTAGNVAGVCVATYRL